jgi:hypothetical protein
MSKKSNVATAVESFLGIRVDLPSGKQFVAHKPLLFRDAIRWQELLERYQLGAPYSQTLGVIVTDIETKLEPEDTSVFNELELGEFVDYVVYSFFSHRRSLPGWMVQLAQDQAAQQRKQPRPAISLTSPSQT